MTLLVINGHNYTGNILSPSWAVNDEEIFQTWVDGNGTSHRDVTRTKVSGKFNFNGRDVRDVTFAQFVADLEQVRTSANAYTITVYCTNTQTLKTIEAFVEYAPSVVRQGGGPTYVDTFDVTIEER